MFLNLKLRWDDLSSSEQKDLIIDLKCSYRENKHIKVNNPDSWRISMLEKLDCN